MTQSVTTEFDARGVATVWLDRPDRANAYDASVIDGLAAACAAVGGREGVRAVVLRGRGRHFSAGADLAFLKEMGAADEATNRDFSRRTTAAVAALAELPVPTVAAVHGACYGGAMGMVAACDVAIGAEGCAFGLTEVRFGIVPAPIALPITLAMGGRALRRWLLTGERFGADVAVQTGLLHRVVPADALDAAVEEVLAALLAGGPRALAETKALVLDLTGGRTDAVLLDRLADLSARARASEEAREGLASFLEKRKPAWAP